MDQIFNYRMNRRTLLGTAAALGVGALLLKGGDASCAAPATASVQANGLKHNIWVWRFDVDGHPDHVLEALRVNGLGVLLKTNDGPDWMSRYDDSPTAITGPQKVREMADYFENAGIPFHAWCVVHGRDPIGEARICSEVLNSGARSMIFDLEPPEGTNYWQGNPADAVALGQEMRRLQPHAQLGVAPDARPWQLDAVPIGEFAAFCNEILPQSYWQTFNSPTNRRYLTERGYFVPPEGVTPEVILDATADKLRPYGLPIRPIGQGTAGGADWARFINHAYSLQMDSVSAWRFGTAHGEMWPTLQALAPSQPAPVAEAPAPAAAEQAAVEPAPAEPAPEASEPAAAPAEQAPPADQAPSAGQSPVAENAQPAPAPQSLEQAQPTAPAAQAQTAAPAAQVPVVATSGPAPATAASSYPSWNSRPAAGRLTRNDLIKGCD